MVGEFIKITPTETLTLPHEKKGWQGSFAAQIRIGLHDGRYHEARSYQYMSGDCRGSSSPLGFWTESARPPRTFDTRDLALKYAVDDLRSELERGLSGFKLRNENPTQQEEIRRQLEWLSRLIPKSGDQLDMFGT